MAEVASTSTAGDAPAEEDQGIPRALFIEDVEKLISARSADVILQELRDHYSKYRMIEQQLLQKKQRLLTKLPDIHKALDIVNTLVAKADSKEVINVDYELSDAVYARAAISDVSSVHLWLGAGVMLEYPLLEAQDVLSRNLINCKTNLKTNEENLAFIKDNVTTTEVSMARVYNADVERRRVAKASGAAADAQSSA